MKAVFESLQLDFNCFKMLPEQKRKQQVKIANMTNEECYQLYHMMSSNFMELCNIVPPCDGQGLLDLFVQTLLLRQLGLSLLS